MKLNMEERQKLAKLYRESYQINKSVLESEDIKTFYADTPEKYEERLLDTERLKEYADRIEQGEDFELNINSNGFGDNWIWGLMCLMLLGFANNTKDSE